MFYIQNFRVKVERIALPGGSSNTGSLADRKDGTGLCFPTKHFAYVIILSTLTSFIESSSNLKQKDKIRQTKRNGTVAGSKLTATCPQ
jgi:hypothetical protein